MKKFFLAAVVLTVCFVSAFANSSDRPDPKAEQVFKRQFAGAKNITWSQEENGVLKVNFVWSGHGTVVYFNEKAEIVASIRNMFFDQLPMTIIRSVDSKFKSPVVIEVREISTEEGTKYSLVLEEGVKKFKVNFNSMGEVLAKKRLKK